MKQKILSRILAGVMAFTILPMTVGAADKETKITFSDATYAKVGDEIKITVSIENNPGFVSATIPVQWDETKLILKRVDETEKIEELLADGITPSGIENCGWIGYEITDAVKNSGLYHLAWNYDTMHDGNYDELEFTEDGNLCVMVFEVIADIKEDTVISADAGNAFTNMMDFWMKDLVKNENTNVTLIFGESTITLAAPPEKPEVLLGDVNGDNKINIIDVDALFRYVMKFDKNEWDEAKIARANVNKDSKINIIDVDKLFRYVMKYDTTLG